MNMSDIAVGALVAIFCIGAIILIKKSKNDPVNNTITEESDSK